MFKGFFEGWYFKHQNNLNTVSLIPGISNSKAFIQIITNNESYNVDFPKEKFLKQGKNVSIENNDFSNKGIKINIKAQNLSVKGEIFYYNLIPLKNDIMGPFKFLPLECRHGIISMYHNLSGGIEINGQLFDFNNGVGYIEKDSGHSFPKRYVWIHSNDFEEQCSVMVSIADIPFLGFHFEGLICAIYYKGKEYRITTYNNGKILKCTREEILICNNNLKLYICLLDHNGQSLYSPISGEMKGIIKESPSCHAQFKFFKEGNLLFDLESSKASCEFVGY